jgi:hypothetical protein
MIGGYRYLVVVPELPKSPKDDKGSPLRSRCALDFIGVEDGREEGAHQEPTVPDAGTHT